MPSAKQVFKNKKARANAKIEPIPRTSSKASMKPIPRANKSAAQIIDDQYTRLEESDAAAWRKARSKKMRRRDI